jgi:hypothetical protein
VIGAPPDYKTSTSRNQYAIIPDETRKIKKQTSIQLVASGIKSTHQVLHFAGDEAATPGSILLSAVKVFRQGCQLWVFG